MSKQHLFTVRMTPDWVDSEATPSPRKLRRRHRIDSPGKTTLHGSAAPAFHGEAERWNPEELFVASLAQCHMLSLIYVLDRDGLELLDYSCDAEGILELDTKGSGSITRVTIFPRCVVGHGQTEAVRAAHSEAHELCFIARSVACEVRVEPEIVEVSAPDTQL